MSRLIFIRLYSRFYELIGFNSEKAGHRTAQSLISGPIPNENELLWIFFTKRREGNEGKGMDGKRMVKGGEGQEKTR